MRELRELRVLVRLRLFCLFYVGFIVGILGGEFLKLGYECVLGFVYDCCDGVCNELLVLVKF